MSEGDKELDLHVQDLNFNIQDILDHHGPLSNDQSFQSIVETINNHEGHGQSYAHLPAELQHLFSSNATEDLLAPQSSSSDASMLSHHNVDAIVNMWNPKANEKQNDPLDVHTQNTPPMHMNHATSTPTPPPPTPPTPPPPQATAAVTPTLPHHMPSIPPAPAPTHPSPLPVSRLMSHPSAPSSHAHMHPSLAPTPMPPTAVSADQFLSQAKMLLGQQQYQQLEDLKNKPNAQPNQGPRNNNTLRNDPMAMMQSTMPLDINDRKRTMNSSQVRAEDAQRAMTGLMKPSAPITTGHSNVSNSTHPTHPTASMSSSFPTSSTSSSTSSSGPSLSMAGPPMSGPPMSGPSISGPSSSGQSNTSGPSGDRIDYDTLTDVMGYAGVDLKEEVEHFLKDGEMVGGSLPDGIDRSKMQDFMNPDMLKNIVLKMAKPLAIGKIDPDFLSYLALATQDRLRHLIEQMVAASKHRVFSQTFDSPPVDDHGQPMYKIIIQQDIKKQLLAIERVEREEERKRKEMMAERERRAQLGDSDGMNMDEDRPKKKKKEKEMGPGVTARNMSEDIRKKHTNETALMSAGGVRKSWMLTGMGKEGNRMSPAPPSPPQLPSYGEPIVEEAPRGRGRPRGRKSEVKRGRGRGLSVPSSVGRDLARQDNVGLFLPPSTIGRPRLGEQGSRTVTVKDAIFALERDCQTGRGNGQRTLLKTYNQWLK
ncbi:transcription initiation factor TFIID component TAF4 family-domain-containing protein [Spinellus fusiger]|nr:transcription initiation factor TFIID component TAF4 family-domain-containing protein [Spinellus fusiger]